MKAVPVPRKDVLPKMTGEEPIDEIGQEPCSGSSRLPVAPMVESGPSGGGRDIHIEIVPQSEHTAERRISPLPSPHSLKRDEHVAAAASPKIDTGSHGKTPARPSDNVTTADAPQAPRGGNLLASDIASKRHGGSGDVEPDPLLEGCSPISRPISVGGMHDSRGE
jgi:hypothetical protein